MKRRTAARKRQPPTVRNGQDVRFSLDRENCDRAAWAAHFLREVVAVPASTSTVVRRALKLYADHLESLLVNPEGIGREQREVLSANNGGFAFLEEREVHAVPVRAFSDLLREHWEARRPVHAIERDLARWNAESAAGEPLSPSEMEN